MGDLLRQACSLMLRAAVKMALPSLIAAYLIILVYHPSGMADDRWMLAALIFATHITLTLSCYTYFETNRRYRIERIDGEIVGREFGGMKKKDRIFCKALRALVDDEVMDALELFLLLTEMELTQQESRLVHFYLGRCYQMTACPSNAISHYIQARDEGLVTNYLDLFLARSYTDGGRYEEAFQTYQALLEKNPKEFYCVRTDIGMMFLRKHDGEQALHWFREAIEQSENYAFALGGCSLSCLLLGDKEQSQTYYEQAVANRMSDAEGFKQFYQELEEVVLQRMNTK